MSEQNKQKVIEALRDVLHDRKSIELKLFQLVKKHLIHRDDLTVAYELLANFEDDIKHMIDEIEKGKKGRFTRERILKELREILFDARGVLPEEVERDTAFVSDLDMDSLSMLSVVVAVEKEFAVTIADEDVRTFRTVGGLVEYLFIHQSHT